jgi:hypothetical protein
MTHPATVFTTGEEHLEAARTVFTRIQLELEDIARAVDHNNSLIAAATGDLPGTSPAIAAAVQQGDLLSQKLAGIAGFIASLAECLPHDLAIETGAATARLKLAELVSRIGSGGNAARERHEVDYGHCDLF